MYRLTSMLPDQPDPIAVKAHGTTMSLSIIQDMLNDHVADYLDNGCQVYRPSNYTVTLIRDGQPVITYAIEQINLVEIPR